MCYLYRKTASDVLMVRRHGCPLWRQDSDDSRTYSDSTASVGTNEPLSDEERGIGNTCLADREAQAVRHIVAKLGGTSTVRH